MTKTIYGLIAYKPSSSDSCRGCHMASYRSDFVYNMEMEQEALIKELAELLYKNNHLLQSETGYEEIDVFKGEVEIDPSDDFWLTTPKYRIVQMEDDLYDELYGNATLKVKEREAKEKQESLDKVAKLNRERTELAEKYEREQYERLRNKYGGVSAQTNT